MDIGDEMSHYRLNRKRRYNTALRGLDAREYVGVPADHVFQCLLWLGG